mgnify:CR=1 FL=1
MFIGCVAPVLQGSLDKAEEVIRYLQRPTRWFLLYCCVGGGGPLFVRKRLRSVVLIIADGLITDFSLLVFTLLLIKVQMVGGAYAVIPESC